MKNLFTSAQLTAECAIVTLVSALYYDYDNDMIDFILFFIQLN